MTGIVLGFSVEPYGSDKIATFVVGASKTVRVNFRVELAPILVGFANDFDRLVEPLRPKDTGGHNPRYIAGTTIWSRHAIGGALDANWGSHPLGAKGTFSAADVKAIHDLINKKWVYKDVPLLRWGGDYIGDKDEMHFEINVQRAFALEAIRALQAPPTAPKPKPATPVRSTIRRGSTGPNVTYCQGRLLKHGLFVGYKPNGNFGPITDRDVRIFQKKKGLVVDGIVGPKTWAKLG